MALAAVPRSIMEEKSKLKVGWVKVDTVDLGATVVVAGEEVLVTTGADATGTAVAVVVVVFGATVVVEEVLVTVEAVVAFGAATDV